MGARGDRQGRHRRSDGERARDAPGGVAPHRCRAGCRPRVSDAARRGGRREEQDGDESRPAQTADEHEAPCPCAYSRE